MRRSTWFLLLYTLTYAAFLVLGGVAMRLMEQEHVDWLRERARDAKEDFLKMYPQVNCELL